MLENQIFHPKLIILDHFNEIKNQLIFKQRVY